ncbi:hypothetical protein EVAR_46414_1 [Eumeta japonica]|uniref:Uncharacterized protein n=1 Tax=Eumeta variegata TaxID=151549 RepID=A0A4C1XEE3_EUMVA|nr:hypothetical protein EVAR_46414_1 [Eumeta japonica]
MLLANSLIRKLWSSLNHNHNFRTRFSNEADGTYASVILKGDRYTTAYPDDIVSTDDIDNAIGTLTSHITTVVENSSRTVPAKSNRRKLPIDVSELIRDKNAALGRAGKYPTSENRSRARALQRKVKAGMKEIRNENWSDLMSEISPSHKPYWGLVKALKTEGAVPIPALKRPDNSIAFDDREKANCLADGIEYQCSENPPYN